MAVNAGISCCSGEGSWDGEQADRRAGGQDGWWSRRRTVDGLQSSRRTKGRFKEATGVQRL